MERVRHGVEGEDDGAAGGGDDEAGGGGGKAGQHATLPGRPTAGQLVWNTTRVSSDLVRNAWGQVGGGVGGVQGCDAPPHHLHRLLVSTAPLHSLHYLVCVGGSGCDTSSRGTPAPGPTATSCRTPSRTTTAPRWEGPDTSLVSAVRSKEEF